jgi:hypothetical protein
MSEPPPVDDVAQDAPQGDPPVAVPRDKRRRQVEVNDPRPFVERYKGTRWDTEPGHVAAPMARRRGTLPWPVVIAGVLVLVAVTVISALVFVGQRQPSGLAAFRQISPPPQPSLLIVPQTSAPSGGVALPTAPVTPPPDWRLDAHHPARLFIDQMTNDHASFHIDAQMSTTAGGYVANVTASIDISGDDSALSMLMTSATTSLHMRTVTKGKYHYVKIDDRPWVRTVVSQRLDDVFGDATGDSYGRLEYIGVETVDGVTLHHVRLPVPGPGAGNAIIEITQAPASFVWDIWIDDAGTPRSARLVSNIVAHLDGGDYGVTLTSDYLFSNFGQKITIKRPAHFRTG